MGQKDYKLEVTDNPTLVTVEVPKEDVMKVFDKLSPKMRSLAFCFEVKEIGFKFKMPKKRLKYNTEVYDD